MLEEKTVFIFRKIMAFDHKSSNKGKDGWEKKANALGRFLSDPGIPGVRSMCLDVSQSDTLLRLN